MVILKGVLIMQKDDLMERYMMSEKEPEQILRGMFDLLAQLEKVKVKTERPIPIVRDRQGRLAKESKIKDWFAKINEEVDELKAEVQSYYGLENIPGGKDCLYEIDKKNITGELCDVIEVLYSMANQMGIDGNMIQKGIHDTNEKLRGRGCI